MFTTNYAHAVQLVTDAQYPEDIFMHAESTPKVVFRLLRKALHEDFAPADKKEEAREGFQKLHNAWGLAESLITRNAFGQKTTLIRSHVAKQGGVSFFVKSRKGVYGDLVILAQGKVSTVYLGTDKAGNNVVVKIATNPSCNQFLENEAAHLHRMKEKFPKKESGRYFPTPIDNFSAVHAGNTLAVNVFEYCEGYVTLSHALDMFKSASEHIDVRAMAWMYNRILESLAHAHPLGLVHGGVHPDNILIHPESHRIVLTGWTSSVMSPEKIPYASAEYMHLYPKEVVGDRASRKSALSSDLYMAAASMYVVLSGNVSTKTLPPHVPKEIRAFLSARLIGDIGLRDAVAIQQRDRFGEVLKAVFGPPKFHPFVLPTSRS